MNLSFSLLFTLYINPVFLNQDSWITSDSNFFYSLWQYHWIYNPLLILLLFWYLWRKYNKKVKQLKEQIDSNNATIKKLHENVDIDHHPSIAGKLIKEISNDLNYNIKDNSRDVGIIPDNNNGDSNEKLIILIVEDDTDMRRFIKSSFGKEFEVVEASNGDQGVRTAEKIIPDLIISDIKMPKLNGYELTRILKNDEKTNHIPIILLTGKSDQQSKFNGLETGADDYIIKPFDAEELRLRVCNLISIRRKLQQKYSFKGKVELKGEELRLNAANEKFMNRINQIIKRHLSEENFTIEDFWHEAGMSRTQLHRKLKAITGKSASRYIRSVRLSAATDMLKNGEGNISEIAYSVGFSSPVYFSKCFKDEYGCSPSESHNL